jgi:hypothetical protein
MPSISKPRWLHVCLSGEEIWYDDEPEEILTRVVDVSTDDAEFQQTWTRHRYQSSRRPSSWLLQGRAGSSIATTTALRSGGGRVSEEDDETA